MRTTRTVFKTIKNTARSEGFCTACGKRTVRQRTFEATINPFNRNAEGEIKTSAEVRADLLARARSWQPNYDHTNCPQIVAERVTRRLKASK